MNWAGKLWVIAFIVLIFGVAVGTCSVLLSEHEGHVKTANRLANAAGALITLAISLAIVGTCLA